MITSVKKFGALMITSTMMASTVIPAFAETSAASNHAAVMPYIASLCISTVANVLGYYICQWLNRKK